MRKQAQAKNAVLMRNFIALLERFAQFYCVSHRVLRNFITRNS
jgi:hypothetical protein